MNLLTYHENGTILDPNAPHWAGGFSSSLSSGAQAMRRKVHGLFYACRLWWAYVGSREACRSRTRSANPYTSAAQGLAASVGGFTSLFWSYPMKTQSQVAPSAQKSNIVPLRAKKAHISFAIPAPNQGGRFLNDQIKDIPEIVGAAIDYILSDFDFEAHPTANTAIAVRLLAIMSERLTTALENNHV